MTLVNRSESDLTMVVRVHTCRIKQGSVKLFHQDNRSGETSARIITNHAPVPRSWRKGKITLHRHAKHSHRFARAYSTTDVGVENAYRQLICPTKCVSHVHPHNNRTQTEARSPRVVPIRLSSKLSHDDYYVRPYVLLSETLGLAPASP